MKVGNREGCELRTSSVCREAGVGEKRGRRFLQLRIWLCELLPKISGCEVTCGDHVVQRQGETFVSTT